MRSKVILFIISAVVTANLYAQKEINAGRHVVRISCSGSADSKTQPVLLEKMSKAIGPNRKYVPTMRTDIKAQYSLVLNVGFMSGRKYIIGELNNNMEENYLPSKTKSYIFNDLDELTDICNKIADELIGKDKSFPSVDIDQSIAEEERLAEEKRLVEEKAAQEKELAKTKEKEEKKLFEQKTKEKKKLTNKEKELAYEHIITLRKGFEVGADFIGGYTVDESIIWGGNISANYRITSRFAVGLGSGYPNVIFANVEYNFTEKKISPFVGFEMGGGLLSKDFHIYNDYFGYSSYSFDTQFEFFMGIKGGVRYSFNKNWALQAGFKSNFWITDFAIDLIGYAGAVYHF
jgi:hypothetical protein